MRVLSMGTISSCLLVAIDRCVCSWRNYFARLATLVEGEGLQRKKLRRRQQSVIFHGHALEWTHRRYNRGRN